MVLENLAAEFVAGIWQGILGGSVNFPKTNFQIVLSNCTAYPCRYK